MRIYSIALIAALLLACGGPAGAATQQLYDSDGSVSGWRADLPQGRGVALLTEDGNTVTEILLRQDPYAGEPLARAQTLLPRARIAQAGYLYPATGNYLLAASETGEDGTDLWHYVDLLTGERVTTGMPAVFVPAATAAQPDAARGAAAATELLKRDAVMPTPYPARTLFRSTHATAAIALLEYWNLRPATEPAQVFAGTVAGFSSRCLCDNPRKPTVWELARGVRGLAGNRRLPITVEENADNFSYADYCWHIDNRLPVLLTLAYGGDNQQSEWRRNRLNSRSALGVGYLKGDGHYIVLAGTSQDAVSVMRWDGAKKLAMVIRNEESEPPGTVSVVKLAVAMETVAALPNPEDTLPVLADTTVLPALSRSGEIHYFYDATCRDCLRTDDYLRTLLAADSGLILHKHNMKNPENVALMVRYYRAYGIPPQEWQGTLVLFAGNRCLRGYDEIVRDLAAAVHDTAAISDSLSLAVTGGDTMLVGEVFSGFTGVSIALAGLADGINPCAFGMLLFFFTCLRAYGRQRREMLAVGLSFAAGVYAAYFLIGLGMLNAIYQLAALGQMTRWLYPAMALLCLILAVCSLMDWRRARRGEWQKMTLQLPERLRNGAHAMVRRCLSVRVAAPTAFAIGLAISVVELACTGQIYLPVLMCIAGDAEMRLHALPWLILYVTMFIVPLLMLFAVVYWGSTAVALTGSARNVMVWSKLVLALIFAALAGHMARIGAHLLLSL